MEVAIEVQMEDCISDTHHSRNSQSERSEVRQLGKQASSAKANPKQKQNLSSPYPNQSPMETTSSSSSSSADPVHLPEDIQAEILKRLPVQTLARFRCVCKSWRRLFNDPSFVKTHLHHSTAPNRIILSRYFKTLLSMSPDPTPNPNPNPSIPTQEIPLPLIDGCTYYVKGHCHGLICVIINDGTIILWNPSIHQHKTLPVPSNFKKTREVLGIGFDSSLNDYKIVRAPSSYCKCKVKDYHPQVEVLTLNSNSWRKLPDHVTPPFFIEHYQQSITLNNALYWLTLDDFSTVVLKFDLVEERFEVVPPPPDDTGRNISWVGVLKDSLCVLHSHRRSYFDIWATRDDRNWEKLITVTKILCPEPCLRSLDYVPVCFVKSGALIISVREKGLVVYDPEMHRYSKLAVLEDVRWLQETVYTESLVSPHGGGERPLEQTGSFNTFTRNLWQMLLGFTNGVVDQFTCHGSGSKKSDG